MGQSLGDELHARYAHHPDYLAERLFLRFSQLIVGQMGIAGVDEGGLAKRLGMPRARLAELLSGERVTTVRALARIADALGFEWVIATRDVSDESDG